MLEVIYQIIAEKPEMFGYASRIVIPPIAHNRPIGGGSTREEGRTMGVKGRERGGVKTEIEEKKKKECRPGMWACANIPA